MHHITTLVVDFDDTLAITLNRDWQNAAPNLPLIEKINRLHSEGWTIHIVTARGQLSCQGNSIEASEKYRTQIETWLANHDVRYNTLSFDKKLAAYYIDDKGITPEDFIKKFHRTVLKGGMSGATVYYDEASDAVYKDAKNTQSVIEWYNFAEPHYNVPKIYSVIGDTIKMEKLHKYVGPFERILDVCYSFRQFEPLHVSLPAHNYIDRCLQRINSEIGRDTLSFDILEKILEYGSKVVPITFSHGDFSISNIMSNSIGHSVYLIDPINDPTLLSSWVIDIAKLYMSIGLETRNMTQLKAIEDFIIEKNITLDCLRAHEIGHLCRVFPYASAEKKEAILDQIRLKTNFFQMFKAR
jgi:capsule biosynthesis phosphatase